MVGHLKFNVMVEPSGLNMSVVHRVDPLTAHLYFNESWFSIHKVLYDCKMEKASDDAQLQKVKQLCTGETCFIDPKEVFDTSLCPGNLLSLVQWFISKCFLGLYPLPKGNPRGPFLLPLRKIHHHQIFILRPLSYRVNIHIFICEAYL